MEPIENLKKGFLKFQTSEFQEKAAIWKDLVEKGQRPQIAVIACSDARVDPAIMMNTNPGEIFAIRNVANLVPPYDKTGGYHGTSAALEYAVQYLEVKHIIVLGHAYCGGIDSLFSKHKPDLPGDNFIPSWMSIAEPAHRRVIATMPGAKESDQIRACEKGSVLVSLENLMTFSCIREKVFNGELYLHGWFVDIHAGTLSCYNAESNQFEEL